MGSPVAQQILLIPIAERSEHIAEVTIRCAQLFILGVFCVVRFASEGAEEMDVMPRFLPSLIHNLTQYQAKPR